MIDWKDFHGPNAAHILELYERFQRDPASVDDHTRAAFNGWQPPAASEAAVAPPPADVQKLIAAVNLAQAIREYGHLAAQLDPLGTSPIGDPALDLAYHNLTESDLAHLPPSVVSGSIGERTASALEAIGELRSVYSSSIGYDYDHLRNPEDRQWLREMAETRHFATANRPIDRLALLERLTRVEGFEKFLHRAFPGKTRFSIEGLDMMIPMLDEIILGAAGSGMTSILIGMAHRGRLNVLAHVLNKPYEQILAEFNDPLQHARDADLHDELGWQGDVKYHLGAHRHLDGARQAKLALAMAPNPSHLEAVNPVVEGMSRAAGTTVDHRGAPRFDPTITLPILIHGDSAFVGQGVVAETLNLSRLPDYRTGATVHIIANNQLGYTAEPMQSRSTLYASDLAKGFKIPIVHVNADDPDACLEVARLAFAYREKFQKDFLIDLIGYRRYGHNEGDEPAFTQPTLYRLIEQHPPVRQRWANSLAAANLITPEQADDSLARYMQSLHDIQQRLKPEESLVEDHPEPPPPGAARKVKTAVPAKRLRAINDSLGALPQGFTLHPKLARTLQKRRGAIDEREPAIDWATAEELAFATILEDGISIRLTGQDAERGTFSQRHAVYHDYHTGQLFIPLQHLPQASASFEARNSPLSENAALGFEYGYNVQAPERFVLWEAQYGDFINGAQTVIDEFITSARAKWGQTPSLALLLPHGHEGQGPDHSSGRLERFLGLAADTNLRIANCTTAAQYFHVLRRQALLLKTDPLPLVVMTPKSLLRHPLVASSLKDLTDGRWQSVINDTLAMNHAKNVRRVVLCSGKVYIDLVQSAMREQQNSVALIRVEQLYPFPGDDIAEALGHYPKARQLVWLQEEPENMGAWEFMRPRLSALTADRWALRYIGRGRKSSPAEGSTARHAINQNRLVTGAFEM